MKLKFALTALVICLGSIGKAQDGPSYEETVAFIQSKLSSIAYAADGQRSFHFFELNRCEFEYHDILNWRSANGTVNRENIYRVQLSSLDPSRVSIGRTNDLYGFRPVVLSTREGQRSISSRYTPLSGCRDQNLCQAGSENVFRMELVSSEPERLQSAVSHLIRLCGGREELF
jgi:hypothetical protein